MNTNLGPRVAALADLSDTELHTPITATYGVPRTAPGLLAWIDSACEGELNRRRDFDYPLLPPEAAIDPSEDAVSISAAIVLREQFAQDSPAVLALFDALVELPTGDALRPGSHELSRNLLTPVNVSLMAARRITREQNCR